MVLFSPPARLSRLGAGAALWLLTMVYTGLTSKIYFLAKHAKIAKRITMIDVKLVLKV